MSKPLASLELAKQAEDAAKWLHHSYVNGNMTDVRKALLKLKSSGTLLILVVGELMDRASGDERQDLLRTFTFLLTQDPPTTGRKQVAALAGLWADSAS